MASGNTGKQLEDAMSYLETQVRGRTMDKEWRDHVRFAWDVSPTLAVYLPQVGSKLLFFPEFSVKRHFKELKRQI